MTKISKVDLSILKKLVGELESALDTADGLMKDASPDVTQHIVEMSKAAGLCMGITQEATLLILDIQATIRGSQLPVDKSTNVIDSLLNSFKMGGGGSKN